MRCSPAVTEQEFSFSETHVFGRFDAFCARIRKILTMFDLIQDYQTLFERRMEGLLLGEGIILIFNFHCTEYKSKLIHMRITYKNLC